MRKANFQGVWSRFPFSIHVDTGVACTHHRLARQVWQRLCSLGISFECILKILEQVDPALFYAFFHFHQRHCLALISEPAWLPKGYCTRYLRIVTVPVNPFQLFDSFFGQIIHSELNRRTQKDNLVPRVLSLLRESTFSKYRKDPGNEVSKRSAWSEITYHPIKQWAICSFSLHLRFIDMKPDGKEEVNLINSVSGQTRSQGLSSLHPKGASEERLLQAGHVPPKTGR